MKRILTLGLSILTIAASTGFAHAQTWTPSEGINGSTALFAVDGMPDAPLVAVGASGTILTSKNGGENWTSHMSGITEQLNAVSVASDARMFAAGNGGRIIRSYDSGVTWMASSAGQKNLHAIQMASGQVGTTVGDSGTIFTTANSGVTWTSRNSNTQNHLYGVWHLSTTTAWAVGAGGKIIFTTNGGTSWNTRIPQTTEDLHDVIFLNNQNGFVVGANGTVIKTTDGGATWMPITSAETTANGRNLHTIDVQEEVLLIGGDGVIMRSDNGGTTWSEEPFANDAPTFYDVHIASNGEWAVGADATGGFIDQLQTDTLPEEPVVEEPEDETAAFGDLIKLICPSTGVVDVNHPCKAVYYYGVDGKRHAFPNEQAYFTWYTNFDDVVEVDGDFLAAIPLGRNVTYKPGVKMVKFMTVNTVYAVGEYGSLRAIASEHVAADLYGANWNTKIDDISDAFYANYRFDETINNASDYDLDAILASDVTIDHVLLAEAI